MKRLLLLVVILGVLVAPAHAVTASKFDTPKNPKVDDGTSVGGVRLEYKRGRVVKKFGTPDGTTPGQSKTFFCDAYGSLGVAVCFKRIKGHVTSAVPHHGKAKKRVKDWNGTVVSIGVTNPGFRTIDNALGVGTVWATLSSARTGTELDWGPDKYGNPPDARAYEVNDPSEPGLTRWFLSGSGTAEDPAIVASFLIGERKYAGTLSSFLDALSPKPES